jgi:hypothetical protein
MRPIRFRKDSHSAATAPEQPAPDRRAKSTRDRFINFCTCEIEDDIKMLFADGVSVIRTV